MSLAQFSKDHGGNITRLVLAASIAFAAYTVGSRFDQIKDVVGEANDTIGKVQETQVALRQDLADLKANLPDFGTTAGESAANAVTKMEEMLECPADKPDCQEDEGLRGMMRRQIDKLHPQP